MQHVEIEVVEHFVGLPYSGAYRAFQAHLKDCEPCAEAHAAREVCTRFCPEGHDRMHRVQRHIDATTAASEWN